MVSLLNAYERPARMYPAFIVVAPILAVAIGQYGVVLDVKHGLSALTVSLGGLYLLANVVREYGKRLEPRLHRKWGGVPTTQLQRHRDPTIETPTKLRHHRFLSGKIGIPFPNADAERANPDAADAIYASGTRWLLEHTRERERFGLLFQENVAYGYRRNALALKPLAVAICISAIAWVLLSTGVIDTHGFDSVAARDLPPGAIGALAACVALLVTWLSFFTERSVKTAAFSYADMLLRACDLLT